MSAEGIVSSIGGRLAPSIIVMSCPHRDIDDARYPALMSEFRVSGSEVVEVARLIEEGRLVSSGLIRELLDLGDVASVVRLAGSPYSVTGIVEAGNQVGRTIGFPTANLAPPPYRVVPRQGVYAAIVELEGQRWPAAVNIGVRPTVDDSGITVIEAHLRGFAGDLYGRNITVEFHHRIRSERRFDGIAALTEQLADDIEVVDRLRLVPSS